jgi:hypothetical protein
MNKNGIQGQLKQLGESLFHLRVVLFLTLLILLYGFIAWRIQSLADAEPDTQAVATQAKTVSQPNIDPALVGKIEQLEDNSVNVQALFDQARQNPFRE